MSFADVLQIAQALLLGFFVLGRWVQSRESHEMVSAKDLAALRAELDEKADCSRVTALDRRMQGEHDERKRLVESLTTTVTSAVQQGAVLTSRVDRLDADVLELRRRVFNGQQNR